MAEIDTLIALLPNAVTAQAWDASGGDFAKSAGFQVVLRGSSARDPDGWRTTTETFRKFGEHAKAYHVGVDMGHYNIEVYFDTPDLGREPVIYFNNEMDAIEQRQAAKRMKEREVKQA